MCTYTLGDTTWKVPPTPTAQSTLIDRQHFELTGFAAVKAETVGGTGERNDGLFAIALFSVLGQ